MAKDCITVDHINSLLLNSEITVETIHDKVTVVTCKLPNGFVIVESSGAVAPANYSEEIGKQICIDRIKNRLWELEGYVLACKLAENK